MHILSTLQVTLDKFWQLPYHHQASLADILSQVQIWQQQRIQKTHHDFFQDSEYQAMANFLVQQLYGNDNFVPLAKQLKTLLPKMQKMEKFIPKNALMAGVMGVESAVFAIQLDVKLAIFLCQNQLTVNKANMLLAYQQVNDMQARQQQIQDLKQMCYHGESLVKSFFVQKAFQLAKPLAYQHQCQVLYDFIDTGFCAIKSIQSMSLFIEPFCQRELTIIQQVHANQPKPFMLM